MRPVHVVRSLLLVGLVGLAPILGSAHAPAVPPPSVAFHGIGDVPGGSFVSLVRDATKHNGIIYAVGASGTSLGPSTNKSVLWTFDGTTSVLTALPEIANSSITTAAVASAITPDAAYIASQVHTVFNKPSVHAVRVTTANPPGASVNQDLNVAPYQSFTFTGSFQNVVQPLATSAANAISDDGSILYGTAIIGNATTTPRTDFQRAVRYDITNQTSVLIPVLNAGDTSNGSVGRGTSADGSVMVGTSFGGPAGLNAFRYDHGTGAVTAIPRLPGGTLSRGIAVSPDGNLTLVFGNSAFLPNGEVYLYDTSTPVPVITRLGSANTAFGPVLGGMTADGSVVAATFGKTGTSVRNAYFHNSRGWWHLTDALRDAGVDITLHWGSLQITGMSSDGTLVFGQGTHDGNTEGFVAEFPVDYLKNFDVPAVPPANTAIVGVWHGDDPDQNPATANDVILAFLADGTYFHMEANIPASDVGGANGFERGRYTWDAQTHVFTTTTVQDTNGDIGLSESIGPAIVDVVGDTLTLSLQTCGPVPPVPCSFAFTRVTSAPGSIVGGWSFGNPIVDDSSGVLVFLSSGEFYFALDDVSVANVNGWDGIEKGTYAWNAATGDFSVAASIDTNGVYGISSPPGPVTLTLSPDQLRLLFTSGGESFPFNRIAVAAATTPTGTNVSVQPITPTGTTPVTVQFGDVTSGGQTTLQTIDPELATSPAPPPGFSLGNPPLYYEIKTTASFTGPVSVCFNYGGISFGAGTPRLFHYEGGAWTDITTSLDTITTTICGTASSLSPFALFVSPVSRTGFHAPVSPLSGFVNTVKGGSTVPLKFNVYVAGIEKTDTAGLSFTVSSVGCADSGAEDPVDFTTTGNTSLRYDATEGVFVQNWKTPKTPGCYLVRMTTTADGVSLTALFKVK